MRLCDKLFYARINSCCFLYKVSFWLRVDVLIAKGVFGFQIVILFFVLVFLFCYPCGGVRDGVVLFIQKI